jgi:oxygen-independent coproporphyrinogen-3 oxidase
MEDFMMVGLRLLTGVNNADFREQFGIGIEEAFERQLDRLLSQNMLLADESGYRLSEQGLLFGNDVFGAFLADDD